MKLKYTSLLMIAGGLLFSSCKKHQQIFNDPYANAQSPLAIATDPQQIPVPASGNAGTEVTIKATGLEAYKDKLEFLFNGQKATIKQITSTSITVIVPDLASSGITSFVVDGQLVFGPRFTVLGKVNLDPTYNNPTGADNTVIKAYQIPNSNQMIIMGNFTNYNNKGIIVPTRRIVRAFADGSWDRSFQVGPGANGPVCDLAKVGAYYYIVGDFTGYSQQSGNVSRIAKIQTNGLIDTVQVTTYLQKTKYVPTFNLGFTGGTVLHVYPSGAHQMIVTGNFNFLTKRNYAANTYDAKDSTVIDSVDVRQLAKLNDNGTLDSTWRFDPTAPGYKPNKFGRSLPGANGAINSIGHDDGSILIYAQRSQFTTFDGQPAASMIRLTAQGAKDPSFNVGTGPDQPITNVSYNKVLNKYLVVGAFNTFNGKPSQYIVRLNYDGSVDDTFKPKLMVGGVPAYAKLFDDGLSIVNGSFRSYDGVIRNGLAILNSAGELQPQYNNTGNISGEIWDVLETKTADNKRALLIMGNFYLFDNQPKNNIVRVTFE